MRFIFAPIGIAAGLLAGIIAQKLLERIWSAIDDEEPPEPSEPDIRYVKLVPALLVEGAVFRLTKGLVDHGLRGGFARATGTWPGEKKEKD